MSARACKAGQLATELPGEDGRLLALLLDGNPDTRGREVPATALSRALGRLGHQVSPTAVKDHRRRVCGCYRKD